MTESIAIRLNYGTKPPRRLALLKVVGLLIACVVIAVCWRPTKSGLIELNNRNDARSASITAYRSALQHVEPIETVAYAEAQDDWPIKVVDDLHGGAARWHTSRADVAGSATPPFWTGPSFRGPPCPAAEGIVGRLYQSYTTAHGNIKCAIGLRPLYNVVIYKGGYATLYGPHPAIFLHARDGGAGERLVYLHFDATTFGAGDPLPLTIEVWKSRILTGPKPLTDSKAALPFYCPPTDHLALNFGQPDPLDPSHFTIPFTAGARHGTIHGYLQPDDTVHLESTEN